MYDGDCLINSVENLFFCVSVLLAQREKNCVKWLKAYIQGQHMF